MTNVWGVVLACLALILGSTFVFFRRYRLSGNTVLPISEAIFFLCSALCVTIFNSFGFILQFYLANFIKWQGYNIHDILVGNTIGQVNDYNTLLNAEPYAAVVCTASLLLAHTRKRPFHFYIVFTASFFILMSAFDIVLTCLYPRSWSEWLCANTIGAPILGVLATATHYYLSKIVDPLKGTLRCVTILLIGMISISVFAGAYFVLERMFLVPSPTYFEATVSALDESIPLMIAPPLSPTTGQLVKDSVFDPISIPHVVTGDFNGDFFSAANFRWKSSHSRIAVYTVSNCSIKHFEDVVRYFRPREDAYAFASQIDLTTEDGLTHAVVPATKWRQFVVSGNRNLDVKHSFFTSVNATEHGKSVRLADFFGGYSTIAIRPTGTSIALGIIPAVQNARINMKFRSGTTRFNGVLKTEDEVPGPKCFAKPMRPNSDLSKLANQVALIIVANTDGGAAATTDVRPSLNLSGKAGAFDYGPIQASDTYSSSDAPFAEGNLRFLSTSRIKFSRLSLYGNKVEAGDLSDAVIWGDSFSAQLRRDGSIALHGTVTGIMAGSARLMRTLWELLDSPIKIFVLSSLVALITLLGRNFLTLVSWTDDGCWHEWGN